MQSGNIWRNNTGPGKGGALQHKASSEWAAWEAFGESGAGRTKLLLAMVWAWLNSLAQEHVYSNQQLGIHDIWHYISQDTFEDNSLSESLSLGGAVQFEGKCNVPVFDTHFLRNEALVAGAAVVSQNSKISFTNCVFEENFTVEPALLSSGGALFLPQNAFLNITGCRFSNNRAGLWGGAVHILASTNISFDSCIFIENNVADSGGGIYSMTPDGNPTYLKKCTFQRNYVNGVGGHGGGGAISLKIGATIIDDGSTFEGNHVSQVGGGAIQMSQESEAILTGSTFFNNSATGLPGGGAIYMQTGSLLNATSVNFTANKALQMLSTTDVDPALSQLCPRKSGANLAEGGSGGHIYAKWLQVPAACGPISETPATRINLNDCVLASSSAMAGGVYCDSCDLKIAGGTIKQNGDHRNNGDYPDKYPVPATQFGGGVYVSKGENTKFAMQNVQCENNIAEIGGCVYYENRTLAENPGESIGDNWSTDSTFPGCSFTGNTATGYGPDFASDINELVVRYLVTFRANQSAELPPGTVAPADPLARPVYIVTSPQASSEVVSLLNIQSNKSFSVDYRPGVPFDFYLQLRDYFTQIATSDLTGSGVVSQLIPDSSRQPGLKAAGMSSQGLTNISRVYIGGAAESVYDWKIESTWFRLNGGKVTREDYMISNVSSTAKQCQVGEKTTYDEDPVMIQRAAARGEDYVALQVIKRCTWCKGGSYLVTTPATECKECPKKGADCDRGGNLIQPKGNYWRHYDSDYIYKCKYTGACLGSPNSEAAMVPTPCKEGMMGPICAVCEKNWANTGTTCVSCDGFKITNQFILFCIAMGVTLVVLVGYIVSKCCGDEDEKAIKSTQALKILMKKKKTVARLVNIFGQAKILVAYFQVVICIMLGGAVEFPANFAYLMDSFAIVNIDVVALIKSMCLLEGDFYAVWLWNFSLPIVVTTVLVGYTWATWPEENDKSEEALYHTAFCWKAVLMLLFFMYPNCTRVMLSMFNCQEIQWSDSETKHFLKADYQLECYTDDWLYYSPWAGLGVLLYPIGVPLVFYFTIYPYAKNDPEQPRAQTLNSAVIKEKFDFLYCRFRPEYWWYETSELVRKALIGVLIPMFVMPGTATNTLLLLTLNLFYICLIFVCWPFRNEDDNVLMSLSLIAIEATLFGALVINGQIDITDDWSDGVNTGLLLGITLTLIVLYIVILLRFQLPFICNHGFPLCYLDCIKESRLNCFKKTKKSKHTLGGDVYPDGQVGVAMNPMNATDVVEMDESELDQLIETYFHRYDLDESGTINSVDELQQLTTNLAFKLKLSLTGQEIDETINSVGQLDDSNGMVLSEYTTWLKENFLEFEDPNDPRNPVSAAMMGAVSMNQDMQMQMQMMGQYEEEESDEDWGDGD